MDPQAGDVVSKCVFVRWGLIIITVFVAEPDSPCMIMGCVAATIEYRTVYLAGGCGCGCVYYGQCQCGAAAAMLLWSAVSRCAYVFVGSPLWAPQLRSATVSYKHNLFGVKHWQ